MSLLKQYNALMEGMSEEDRITAFNNRFSYIHSKAYLFMKMKPEIYRKNDFFAQPPADLNDADIAILKNGCQQVLEGRGFKKENPFTELGVGGFYALMRMFHFESFDRETFYKHEHDGVIGIMDCITFKHIVDDTEVVYYNFCG